MLAALLMSTSVLAAGRAAPPLVAPPGTPVAAAPARPSRLMAGTWGGEHAALSVTEGGARLEFDCASGEIATPIEAAPDGRIDVAGVFVPERGGPTRDREASNRRRARYAGRVEDNALTLTVTLVESGEEVGTFSLTYGAAPRLRKCR